LQPCVHVSALNREKLRLESLPPAGQQDQESNNHRINVALGLALGFWIFMRFSLRFEGQKVRRSTELCQRKVWRAQIPLQNQPLFSDYHFEVDGIAEFV